MISIKLWVEQPHHEKLIMKNLHKIASKSLNLAIGVAVVTAALNLLWVANYSGDLFQSRSASIAQGGTGWLIDQSVVRMYLIIEVALITAALGLLSRKVKGIVISALALMWVGIEYGGWFIWTLRTIEASGLKEIPSGIPHAGGFYGATGWNMAVLVIAAALFAWEIKTLIAILIGSRSKHNISNNSSASSESQ